MTFDTIIHNPPLERAAHCETHGDYIGKCHMRSVWLGCPKCSVEKQAREESEQAAHDERVKTQEWNAKIERAGIPPRFRDRTISGYVATTPEQRAAVAFARDYAMNFEQVRDSGRCALFLGKPGTGKTHLATAIGLHAMRKHHAKVMFTTVLRAVRMVKDSWIKGSGVSESQVIQSMVEPDLLILDEVGVQFGSEFEKNILFDVFNERYELRKPTILLSNLTKDEVQSFVGERVMDRIKEDGGAVVAFTWDSHRKNVTAGG
ncbi:AAA family ATPase [Lampropedia aestuarii]|uniref:AAA family ATPase n=1 Tax=Lampropedia aestuarii TaxID=2562762 RepID=A0A4S5BMU5_9BURK|nr:ATP-binding protein [Lampropedia aestuarii]THJ32393.1 AAA family ATPase [Lampropedia aestuarii]